MVKFNLFKKFLRYFLFLVLLLPAVSLADYQVSGFITSTNLLPVSGTSIINKVDYSAIIPVGTSLKMQFSYDNNFWYGSNGVENDWSLLTTGDNSIDLSALGWKKAYFFYRVWFISDGTDTPILDSVGVSFMSFDGTYYTYSSSGTLISANLLPSDGVGAINSFSYSISGIPPDTGVQLAFSRDNSTWYNSAGESGGFDTLTAGTNSLDLSGLGWEGGNFYYKALFTSSGSDTPTLDSISLNYISSNYFWVGSDGGNWSSSANWSASSGGTGGFGVPSSGDTAIFDGGDVSDAVVDTNITVSNLKINSGYSGTISQTSNSIEVTGDLIVSAGTLAVGTNNLTVTGNSTVNANLTMGSSGDTGWTTGNLTIGAGGIVTANGTYYNQVTVTGTLSPDATGTYTYAGVINGYPYYQLGIWYVWHNEIFTSPSWRWRITQSVGSIPAGIGNWAKDSSDDLLTHYLYVPNSPASGTATVANVTASGFIPSKVTISGNYDQSSITSKFLAYGSLITVNGNGTFTADGTLDSTQYNGASLVLNGTNTLTYGSLANTISNGFGNLTAGQSGNTTTITGHFAVASLLTIGSGTLTGLYTVAVLGANPLSFDTNSNLSIGTLTFFGYPAQTIPSLANGYNSNLQVRRSTDTVTQTGDIILNSTKNFTILGDGANNELTWKTDGYNLTVGGNVRIGNGSDTGLKKLDATNYTNTDPTAKSTITVGGNWLNYGTGSAPSQFVADNSTVVMTGTGAGGTITSGSSINPNAFYNLTQNGSGGTYTLQDGLSVSGNLTLTAGTLDTKSAVNNAVTLAGNFSQATTAKFTARSSTITVNGNGTFTADGTLDSTQYNTTSLVLNGTNTLTYGNCFGSSFFRGFNNITGGQGASHPGYVTTLSGSFSVNSITVGKGKVSGFTYLFLYGDNPINVDSVNSEITGSSVYFTKNQTIPAMEHGYPVLAIWPQNGLNTAWPPATITQTGNVITSRIFVYSANSAALSSTWLTDGYNLTVGGNIQIGNGSDTGLKQLDATGAGGRTSTITVGGNWLNYGTGSAPSQFVADNSTVIFNSTATGKTITSGTTNSAFNNVTFNGADGGWTLLDNLAALGTLTHTAGTLSTGGKNITTTGNLTISDGTSITASGLAGSTLTVGGNFSASGHAGALLTLNPSSSWYLNVAGTAVVNYVNVAYSDASGGTLISQTNSTDGGHNTNWGFDLTPPTTTVSATHSTGSGQVAYTFGTWSATSAVVTLSCADNDGGSGCASGYPKYCVDTANTCNPVTGGISYTIPVNISTEGVSYIRYYSTDVSGNPETVKSSAIWIDTTAPVVGATTLSGFTTYSTFIKGTGTIVGGTVTDVGGSGIDNTTCDYSANDGTSWSTGVWSTDHCVKTGLVVTDGEYYTFNTRVKDAVTNQGIGTSAVTYLGDTTAPATTDSSDTNWHGDDQTITLTSTDGTGSGVAHTYYCVDTTDTCTPTTVGTSVPISCVAGNVCQQYVRYYSVDNLGNIQTVVSRLIKIDTSSPVKTNFSPVSGSNISAGSTVTFTLNEFGDCRMSIGSAKSYAGMSGDVGCTVANGIQISCLVPELGTAGTKDFYFSCQDSLNNQDILASSTHLTYIKPRVETTTSSSGSVAKSISQTFNQYKVSINNGNYSTNERVVVLNLSTLANINPSVVVISDNPDFSNASILPYAEKINFDICGSGKICVDGAYKIYVKVVDSEGRPTPAFSESINLNAVSFSAETLAKVKELFTTIFPQTEKINYPSIKSAVTPEAPDSLKGKWEIVSPKGVGDIVFADLPREFVSIVNKFPEVRVALEKIGVGKPIDIDRLKAVKINLPGLSEAVGLSAGEKLSLSAMTNKQAVEVPSGIVFARGAGGTIDIISKLAISNKGMAVQTISTVQGQTLSLVYKPEEQAKKVFGYLLFKSNNKNTASKFNIKPASMTANVGQVEFSEKSDSGEIDLVLNKFEYKDSGNGVWTAEVVSPFVLGQYELRTVIEYVNETRADKEMSMILLVDPEGYVYRKLPDGSEARIASANVSIFWLNPVSKNYELWPAKEFRQENPQTTDVTGRYAFLVPPGEYYLLAKADSYKEYKSDTFKVEENKGVFINIELKQKFSLIKQFDIQTVLLGLILLVLVYMVIKRKKAGVVVV